MNNKLIESSLNGREWFQTRDRVQVDFSSDYWKFSANGERWLFDFRMIGNVCSEELAISIKKLAKENLQNLAPSTAEKYHEHIIRFIRSNNAFLEEGLDLIRKEDVINYNSTLTLRRKWHFGCLSIALRKIYELGYWGVPAETYNLLLEMPAGRNFSGEAVLTHNPHLGPLSDVELEGLVAALDRSFSIGELSLEDFVLTWLFLATGRRNLQLCALKLKDFAVEASNDGTKFYWLNVPRAKQRGIGIRASFRRFKLSPHVGELVEIFVAWRRTNDLHRVADDAPFFRGAGAGPGLDGHMAASALGRKLSTIVSRLKVFSPRTKGLLHVNPRRLRYTLGTRAAAEGANEFEIAELLDQSTSETARIYVKASPQMLDRIDRAIAEQMAPFAQAFAGVLVDGEGAARRGQDPISRIIDPTVVDDPVGTCGSYGFCSLAAPIACYTCINFQPWLDAPHDEILESLIAKRQGLIDRNEDIRIASINDRTILAVTRVVQLCREKRARLAGNGGQP